MVIEDWRLMRLEEVLHLCGISKSTLNDLIAIGEFPKPVRISARAVGWRAWEVLAWLKARPPAAETGWR